MFYNPPFKAYLRVPPMLYLVVALVSYGLGVGESEECALNALPTAQGVFKIALFLISIISLFMV